MSYISYYLFSYSIFIAAAIGLIRFKKLNKAYYPFIFLLWAGSANELISSVVQSRGGSSNLNNNIYVLAEALLLVWQARNWKVFETNKWLFWVLEIGLLLSWLSEAMLSGGLSQLHSVFRIIAGTVILMIFIGFSNRLLFQYAKPVAKDAAFLISIGLIFFFSFKILVEIYWWQGATSSVRYLEGLYLVVACINLFVNLLYIIAVLWIPTKARFTTFS